MIGRDDAVAGITAAAIVVPIAMAHATIAGLPVEAGLCTVIAPMVAYALLGTSRVLSVSTTSTIAILVAAATAEVAAGADAARSSGIASCLALMAGAMLVAASIARMGFVANFISAPVLTGFKAGIGLVIIADQLPKLLGVHIEKAGFFRDLVAIARELAAVSWPTLAVGATLIALIALGKRWKPAVPWALIGIALAVAATALLGLERAGVETAGALHGGLRAPHLPPLDLAMDLWPAAAGVALMSFTESIAAGRAFVSSSDPRPAPNREALAIGAANIAGALFGGMPAGGGTTQTAVNRSAGARTQLAAVVTAACAIAALVWLAPVITLLPRAALAAVVVVYSIGLVKMSEFRAIRSVRTTEFRWALIAFAGVLMLGTLRGILVAIAASLLAIMHQANNPPLHEIGRKRGTHIYRPRSDEHPGDETWPGLLVLRPEGRLYFANAEHVSDRMRESFERAGPRVVIIDMRAVLDIEYTALMMLTAAEENLRGQGVELWVAAMTPQVDRVVRDAALGRRLGAHRIFPSLQLAVEAYEQRARSDEGKAA